MVLGLFEHASLARSQLVQMFVYSFDRAIFCDKLAGPYFSYAFHPRYVVGGIPADGKHVDDLQGALDSVFGTDFLDSQHFFFASALSWLVLPDVVFNQLPVILVRRYHKHVVALTSGTFRG